jgi:hypothetical protein
MSRWTAASDFDYDEELSSTPRPVRMTCVACGEAVDVERDDERPIAVRCRFCQEADDTEVTS